LIRHCPVQASGIADGQYASYFVVDAKALLASVIGAIALNLVIWMNHWRDRYVGWSAP
jgi:hypothetical protein